MPQDNQIQVDNTTSHSIAKMNDVQVKWQSILKNSQYNDCNYILAMQQAWANNPFLRNDRLKKVSSYPKLHSKDTLEQALKDPRSNEQTLREASWLYNYQIAPIMKMAYMYSELLLYNWYIVPTNVNKSDLKTPKFKKEYKFINEYIRKLNPKRKFRNIVLQSIREGKTFLYLREQIKDGKISFVDYQFMPSDWCKITYRTPQNGYGYSFNLFYFMTAGNSVSQYAPEFKDYIEEMWGCVDKDTHKIINWNKVPSDVMIETARHTFGVDYLYWKELEPRKAFVISFDDTDAAVLPVFTSSFLSASDLSAYRSLQQELLTLPLSQIMTGTVPMNDGDNKSGVYGNDTKLTPELILMFQGIFDSMAQGLPIKSFFAPLENFQLHKFDSPNREDIVGTAIQNFYSESGLSGLLTTSEKPSIAQIKTSQQTEVQFAKKIYDQLEDMVNRCFGELDLKYEFIFKLFGDVFNRDNEIQVIQKDLMTGQKYLLPKYAAIHDLTLLDTDCLCDLVDSMKIYSKFEPMQSGYNSKIDKKNGRPEISDNDLESDSTAISKDQGTNKSETRITE